VEEKKPRGFYGNRRIWHKEKKGRDGRVSRKKGKKIEKWKKKL